MRPTDFLATLRRRATRLGVRHDETEGGVSHLKVVHGDRRTVLPMRRGNLPAGTLAAVLRQLGLSRKDLED